MPKSGVMTHNNCPLFVRHVDNRRLDGSSLERIDLSQVVLTDRLRSTVCDANPNLLYDALADEHIVR